MSTHHLSRSPIDADEKEIIKLAKKLKKEKVCNLELLRLNSSSPVLTFPRLSSHVLTCPHPQVNIDIVSFGEDECNADILNKFITTING